MELFGFLALVVIGGYVTFAGLVAQVATAGLSGKNSVGGIVILVVGISMLYIAWVNKPFAIVFN